MLRMNQKNDGAWRDVASIPNQDYFPLTIALVSGEIIKTFVVKNPVTGFHKLAWGGHITEVVGWRAGH